MAISTKGKRKININGRIFVYKIRDWDLRIASHDRKFIVSMLTFYTPWTPQPKEGLPMKISGNEFPGLSDQIKQRPVVILYPSLDYNIRPAGIREIILWCLNPEKEIVFFNKDEHLDSSNL